MLIVWITVVSISFIYIILIFSFAVGWYKVDVFVPDTNRFSTKISVIIPVRNEQDNILKILSNLDTQKLSNNMYEVIVVNDNSTDNSYSLIKNFIENKDNFTLVDLKDKSGKKMAIAKGVEIATYDLIAVTDADCSLNNKWLFTIIKFYEKYRPKLIIGAVLMSGKNVLGELQSLEFISLMSVTAGAVGIGRPVMCSGANLIFEKHIFEKREIKQHIASGDDMFLLHSVKKHFKNSVMFLKSKDAVVETQALESIKDVLSQRMRWVSKNRFYTDFDTVFTALATFLVNLVLFILSVSVLFDYRLFFCFLFLFVNKVIIDFVLVVPVLMFYKKQKLIKYIIPLQVLYFIYVSLVGIAGNIFSYSWKGRMHDK